MDRIVVVGARGQLAVELQQQRKVLAFSRQEIDLMDPLSIWKGLKPLAFDVLINAAAYNQTEKAENEPEVAYRMNAHAVHELALVAEEKGAIFVHIGTDFVFSGKKGGAYVEEDPVAPLSVYGASKMLGEQRALKYSRSYVFRTASLFSKGGVNFIEALLKRARENQELRVIEDMTMSPTHAFFLAEAIYKALDKGIPFGLYHATNKGGVSWLQFAEAIIKRAFSRSESLPFVTPCLATNYPSAIKRPKNSVLDVSRLEEYIGEMAPWEEALDRYFGGTLCQKKY